MIQEIAHYIFKLDDLMGEFGAEYDDSTSGIDVHIYLMTQDRQVIRDLDTYLASKGYKGAVNWFDGCYWTDVDANFHTNDESIIEDLAEHFNARRCEY